MRFASAALAAAGPRRAMRLRSIISFAIAVRVRRVSCAKSGRGVIGRTAVEKLPNEVS